LSGPETRNAALVRLLAHPLSALLNHLLRDTLALIQFPPGLGFLQQGASDGVSPLIAEMGLTKRNGGIPKGTIHPKLGSGGAGTDRTTRLNRTEGASSSHSLSGSPLSWDQSRQSAARRFCTFAIRLTRFHHQRNPAGGRLARGGQVSARRGKFSERRRMESGDRRETSPIDCRALSLDRGDPRNGPPRLSARPCLTPNSAFSGADPVQRPSVNFVPL